MEYAEVKRLIGFLPHPLLEQLALGPEPGTETCRVCTVLKTLPSSGPAAELLEWHDVRERGFYTVREVWSAHKPRKHDVVEVANAFADLCYTRCCLIYALAGEAVASNRLTVAA